MNQEIDDLKENLFSIEHTLNQSHKRLKIICISALVLSILSFVFVVLLVFVVFVKSTYDRAMSNPVIMPSMASSRAPRSSSSSRSSESAKEDLEQIQKASVIVYAKNVTEGKKVHCVLDEIWFKSKDAKFKLKPGDKLAGLGNDVKPNTSYGQGQIVFFEGKSPSGFSASWSVHRNTVPSFLDLDLNQVKEIIKSMKDPLLFQE